MNKITLKATGSIAPSRFLLGDTTADGCVVEATAGAKIIGVSHESVRRAPYSSLDDGYAAISGEMIEVYCAVSECYLELGGTVTRFDRLKAGTGGKGVVTTTDRDEWGAIAMQSGVSGDLIKVKVMPFGQVSAA